MEKGITVVLEQISLQMNGIQTDIKEIRTDIKNLQTDMIDVKSDIKELKLNQSNFDLDLRNVRILIENDVMKKIDLLYENRDVVLSRIDKIDRLNKTEDDIELLKIAVSSNSRDITELKKRQAI